MRGGICLGKMHEQQQGKPKPQRARKSKAISKAVIETEDISSVEDFALSSPAGGAVAAGRRSSAKVKKEVKVPTLSIHFNFNGWTEYFKLSINLVSIGF